MWVFNMHRQILPHSGSDTVATLQVHEILLVLMSVMACCDGGNLFLAIIPACCVVSTIRADTNVCVSAPYT